MMATKEKKSISPIEHPSGDARFKLVDRALKRLQYQQDALIEVLHVAQEAFGYLDEGLLVYVARQLKLPPSWVFGVATFYHFFSLEPKGEHSCIVCLGTACYVKGIKEVISRIGNQYQLKEGCTTEDRRFTLDAVRCLGACGLAPVVVVDEDTYGGVKADKIIEMLDKYE